MAGLGVDAMLGKRELGGAESPRGGVCEAPGSFNASDARGLSPNN